jgi:hypothetical protein
MRTVRLVALSDDGKALILALEDPEGGDERFELPIDERVRAAARGDARLGAIEDLGNTLPPRVIQARIRAGETPEQVAAASGTRVERIMRFAHPVLQERARIAEQARDARVRLSEGTPTITLQKFMTERLRLLGSDGDAVRWDAHRDNEGTWLVTGAWRAGQKSGTTLWSYDIPARTVTPVDAATSDFAEGTRLVRVVPDVPGGAAAVPDPVPATRRPVAAVPEPAPVPAQPTGHEPSDDVVRDVIPDAGTPVAEPAVEGLDGVDDIAEHDTVVLGRPGEDGDDGEDPRARIPAWEDIVFGVRRNR